jgi:type VI secretion system protein ImpK
MTPKFAEAVDPVFLHVLDLLDRIKQSPDTSSLSPGEERGTIKYWLDQARAKLGDTKDWELAKYALVSWIDEVLIDAIWEGCAWWGENALEPEEYHAREAYSKFYEKAKEATTLARRDALEVYYVCLVLGFRGLYRDPEAASREAEHYDLPPDKEAWAKQAAMFIRIGHAPTLTEGSLPGEGAMPLNGFFLLIGSVFLAVALAAIVTIAFCWKFLA